MRKNELLIQGFLAALFFLLLLFLATIAIMIFESTADADGSEFLCNTDKCANTMIAYKVRMFPGNPMNDASKRSVVSRLIGYEARKRSLPVALVVAISYRESSFRRSAIGFKGKEIGYMQVHPLTAKSFGCRSMDTAGGQIECGCIVLKAGLDKCVTLHGAVSYYASRRGVCKPKKNGKLDWVVNDRLRIAKRLEKAAREKLLSMDPKDPAHPLE